MQTSMVTAKGQVTIPAKVRHQLGIHQGDQVGFISEGNQIIMLPIITNIEASFGILKSNHSVSIDDMQTAISNMGKK